jgi:hypothetical protein
MSFQDARHTAIDSSCAGLRVRGTPDIGDSEAFRTCLASQYRRSARPQTALVASRWLTASRAHPPARRHRGVQSPYELNPRLSPTGCLRRRVAAVETPGSLSMRLRKQPYLLGGHSLTAWRRTAQQKKKEQVMSKHFGVSRMIGYSSGAALGASLIVLLIGMWLLGFDPTQWGESQGRLVGVAGTIAGVAGAVGGLLIAGRAERRAVK